ncbi:class I SAM-dependent methyltransferase [Dokdonella fugitiva]|uniref:Methyltransferase family protein n=1 Tax=Dokdonella fugitiva TaxID=328517 RepID=A0A4R2IK55_9GAMM|nr:class I SAM-dependent methyltransferase [Dokdonella fugitiva]TCO43085.1 methyltransferase family protein [Dokdonella fugitiva]
MPELALIHAALTAPTADAPIAFTIRFEVDADVAFDVDVSLDIEDASTGSPRLKAQLAAAGWDVSWLPRGHYEVHALAPRMPLPAGRYDAHVALWHRDAGARVKSGAARIAFEVDAAAADPSATLAWQLRSLPGTVPLDRLSWRRGGGDWFFKHFDHAARTTASYLLGDSPLLRGRILDVGCGDGITDLGIALRWRPQELVGIDPFRGYERLGEVLAGTALPASVVPPSLRFLPASANEIPFEDDRFDVVISWGSLEHIVGGYAQALREIRRVLRPGGLLMAHPGLFYSDVGNHLGEFPFAREEPYVHLKRSREWLRERVLAGEPDRMDRSGDVATPAQYWQWFTELNPITVGGFERELRELGFEPWRVALRTHDRVDYTAELQSYSFVDLAVGELYVSAWNRKR